MADLASAKSANPFESSLRAIAVDVPGLVAGWTVLRFCYEDVMFDPESVRDTLVQAVALAEVLKNLREGLPHAA